MLDPALLRPGRFDRRIVVPRPDLHGRLGILKVHTKKCRSRRSTLTQIARGTPGFSGADLENLVNEAALCARAQEQGSSRWRLRGGEGQGPHGHRAALDDHHREGEADHGDPRGRPRAGREAPPGPTDPVHKVTIIPRGRALGLTQQLPHEDRLNINQEFALNQIAILMGGRVAEEIVFGQKTTGAGNDIERATDLARSMVSEWGMSEKLGPLAFGKKEGEVFLGREMSAVADLLRGDRARDRRRGAPHRVEQYERAKKVLLENRPVLDKIADALLEYETLDADDIDVISPAARSPARRRRSRSRPPSPRRRKAGSRRSRGAPKGAQGRRPRRRQGVVQPRGRAFAGGGCVIRIGARLFEGPGPFLMGVVNATPDSFSDGGRLPRAGAAGRRRRSGSPRRAPTSWTWAASPRGPAPAGAADEELARVLPVIERLAGARVRRCRSRWTPRRARSRARRSRPARTS